MKQSDFNKIPPGDLEKLLRVYPEREAAQNAALAILGQDAKTWYESRTLQSRHRIIDPDSGKWVSQFTANGNKYFIRSAADGLGFKRYVEMKRILSVVGFDATYSEQLNALNRITSAANTLVTKTPQLDVLFREIENMRESIRRTERKWDYSLFAATLFIVRPDEDLNEWSEAQAEEKIEDWQAEGLHEQDFFLLVILWASQLSDWWRSLPERVKAIAKQLSPEVS